MSIAEKLTVVAENVQKVYEAGYEKGKAEGGSDYTEGYKNGYSVGMATGKDTQRFNFWSGLQKYGNLNDYSYLFYGWEEGIFEPQYDIYPKNGTYMFGNFNTSNRIVSLTELLNRYKVSLDTSRCTNFSYMFYFSWINTVPTLDTRAASDLTKMFNCATRTITIEKIILKDDGSQTFYTGSSDNCFYNCNTLVDVAFDGVIGNNIGFRNSTKLSATSMANIMEHLSTTATEKTVHFNQTAVNAAVFPITSPTNPNVKYDSWEDLITKTKPSGWTVNIVA